MDLDLDETEARLRPQVLTGQIIAGTLILGVLLFGAFVAISNAAAEAGPEGLGPDGGVVLEEAEADVEGGELDADLDPGDPLISYVALGVAVVVLVLYKPLASVVASAAPAGEAAGAFQSRLIVRLAMLEGAAFLNLVALMLEDWWPLWLVVAVLLIAMLTEVPTAQKLRRFMEGRAQLAQLEPTGRD
ncbi:hypothetical protein [Alienimonas californiensis]|uniref:Uncharacterized protein n=1 Tax=Alienimonas californiensis TaxID=2527989 RepID=A0A517P8D5_9PLAN|nr:hypothetical protein [Alienimonas californiensis]QDT15636.1 hypothetical protein CA12_17210 [Alienimonas californiensis]